jgi:hypothetical protein
VSGDFAQAGLQQAVQDKIRIKKGSTTLHSSTANVFGPPVMAANSILLSSRGGGAAGLPSHPAIGASDEWNLEFDASFFTASAPMLVNYVSDVLLVITVRGTRA